MRVSLNKILPPDTCSHMHILLPLGSHVHLAEPGCRHYEPGDQAKNSQEIRPLLVACGMWALETS